LPEAAIATVPSGISGAVDPVIAAICGVVVITALRMPLLMSELTVTNDHAEGTGTILQQLRDGVTGLGLVGHLWWIAFVVGGVLWIRWQESVHAQLYHAHVGGLLRPPWLSVLAWFVPFIALAVPGFLVGRLLRGARTGPESDARSAAPGLVVWFWWLLFAPAWVVCTLGAFLRTVARTSLARGTASSVRAGEIVGLLRTADTVLLVGSVLLLIAAVLAVVVHVQIDRARRRTMSSWAPPRPDRGEPSPLD
jgi:uncharacterized membrane protein